MTTDGKTTSFDIAFEAGVSQSTVSRALRDSPLVKKDTREKIKEIARRLNYQVDKNAANLRSQQSKTLALLIFEDPTSDESLINPFFLSMLGSATRSAARQGYDLLVSFQQSSKDWHSEYMMSSRADGLILLGYGDYVSYREKLESLEKANSHFIIWGPIVDNQPGHSLGCDNLQGCYDATKHLIQLGHRDIAFLGEASASSPELLQRYQGYLNALDEAGIAADAELQFDAASHEASGIQAIDNLLAKGKNFTGIITASDLIAIGALRALKRHGLKVPDDIAVVGFDDIPAASYVSPALTTIHQDTKLSGELLVGNLIKMINSEPVESSLITPHLVVRKTCGAELKSSTD